MAKQRMRSAVATHSDIRDVARRAKVSVSTVSRVINGVSTVSPVLAKRVWKAAEDLGYSPNTQARSLASGRSQMLGLVISEITNPFFPELIQQFEDAANGDGYEVVVGFINHEPQRMSRFIRRMVERRAEGIAIMTFGMETPLVHDLATCELPFVLMDTGPEIPNANVLAVDYQTGIDQGVQHLAAMGHRKIAFISGPSTHFSAQSRHNAFCNSLSRVGVSPRSEWLVLGDHTLNGGIRAMQTIMAGTDRPTAVMCSNDMTAIGVLHALYEQNVRVPEQMSVIGFDNIQMSAFTLPPLTTIEMSCAEIARCAIDMLRGKVKPSDGNKRAPHFSPIATKLVVRKSTGYPPPASTQLR
jgi:DNA-binding LacI/PurR family transcriptional regulator